MLAYTMPLLNVYTAVDVYLSVHSGELKSTVTAPISNS